MSKVEYNELELTRTMRGLPRFGHSSNFAHLFGTDEESSDYIKGLLFAGVFILSFFVAWSIVLMVLKCLGKKRVGFLAGAAFELPKAHKRPLICRISFLISCIMVITFAVLLVTKGLTNIYNTVDTMYGSSLDVESIINDADAAVASLKSVGSSALVLRDEVLRFTTPQFCPAQPDLEQITGVDFDPIVEKTVLGLTALGDFLDGNATELREGLDTARRSNEDVQDTTQNIDVNDAESLIIIVPFVSLTFFLMVGLALAWFDKDVRWYQCFLTWFILPLFILMVFFSYVMSGAIAIAASANADFCSGGPEKTPDGTVLEILLQNGFGEEDLVFLVIRHYVQQCSSETPFNFLEKFINELTSAIDSVLNFDIGLDNSTVAVDELSELCGQNYTSLATSVDSLEDQLRILFGAVDSILDILSCERIVPIYTNTFYGGTCKYSVSGVTWAFSAFLVVAIFGMIMIMFRSSYLPNAHGEDKHIIDYQEEEGVEVEYSPYQYPQESGSRSYEEHYGGDENQEEEQYTASKGEAEGSFGNGGSFGQSSSGEYVDIAVPAYHGGASAGVEHPTDGGEDNWLAMDNHDAEPTKPTY